MKKIILLGLLMGLTVKAMAVGHTGKLEALKVVVGTMTAPSGTSSIFVSTNINSTADVTASTFHGDGTNLTGVIHSTDTVVGDETTIHKNGQTFSVMSTSVTLKGNAVNGVNELIQTDGSGRYPGLDGSQITNVIHSTNTVLGDEVTIHKNGQTFSVISTSVTLQGNAVNGVNQLIKTDGSGKYPAIDGSNITNLPTQGGHGSYSASNYALGVGTFSYTTLGVARTLTRITATIISSGEGGATGTVWCCGKSGGTLCVTSAAGAAAGSNSTQAGSAAIAGGDSLMLVMDSSDETITPTANVVCEYQ